MLALLNKSMDFFEDKISQQHKMHVLFGFFQTGTVSLKNCDHVRLVVT